MSRKWTQRYVREGDAISPESIQQELSTSQSSVTTLDRDQMPAAGINNSYVSNYSFLRVWDDIQFPDTSGKAGEQAVARDTNVAANAFQAITYQTFAAGWFEVGSTTLTGFKGGSLHLEWSGNATSNPIFSDTINARNPGNPKYMRYRILVNGIVLVERRGTAYHEHFRVFGGGVFPQGDLPVSFQAQYARVGPDEAIVDTAASKPIMQAHIYSMKFFAIGRWR